MLLPCPTVHNVTGIERVPAVCLRQQKPHCHILDADRAGTWTTDRGSGIEQRDLIIFHFFYFNKSARINNVPSAGTLVVFNKKNLFHLHADDVVAVLILFRRARAGGGEGGGIDASPPLTGTERKCSCS